MKSYQLLLLCAISFTKVAPLLFHSHYFCLKKLLTLVADVASIWECNFMPFLSTFSTLIWKEGRIRVI